jgi:Luciferase-like monooxygenase
MKIGVTMFATDYAIAPHELAAEAEARGFESVWFPEHSHIPTSRKSPWPGGAELRKWYYDTYDPFVAMGAAAVVTKTIKLGTGVCLVVQRDPTTPPRRSPPSTGCPTVACCSASAAAGTPRRWPTTARRLVHASR